MGTVIERLDEYLLFKGDNDNQFRVKTKLSQGFMDKARKNNTDSFQKKTIEKIKKAYPSLNTSWLLTGDGQREIGSILLGSSISSVPDNKPIQVPVNEYLEMSHKIEILTIRYEAALQATEAQYRLIESKEQEIETLKDMIANLKAKLYLKAE